MSRFKFGLENLRRTFLFKPRLMPDEVVQAGLPALIAHAEKAGYSFAMEHTEILSDAQVQYYAEKYAGGGSPWYGGYQIIWVWDQSLSYIGREFTKTQEQLIWDTGYTHWIIGYKTGLEKRQASISLVS